MKNFHRRLFGAILLFVTSFAHAQAPPPASSPNILPSSQAFTSYRSFTLEPITPWPIANATVAQIGGWRSYAREANALPEAAAPLPPTGGKASDTRGRTP